MKDSFYATSLRQIVAFIFFIGPIFGYAESSLQPTVMQNYTFSYSIIEAQSDSVELSEVVRNKILPQVTQNGGKNYATWVYAQKPADAPFSGLAKNQVGLMLAWPSDAQQQVDVFNEALQSIDSLTIVSSRLFEAIYLPAGLSVPTMKGFYVHREEEYKLEHVNDAVRLSKEAWKTWEPHWGVKVIGLFREIGNVTDFDNLNRIVWYPSYEGWLETRNFTEDMESAKRFRERRALLVPGSGIAIATDRLLP